jgi:diketogulonate reductase-like aldo/keto reductase
MRLRSGERIAALGYGTLHFAESPARRAEQVASVWLDVDLGMTAIDIAEMYSNGAAEALVGEAISGRRSEELLVAKVLPHHATRVATVRAYEASLGGLGVDYIDLHLPHWRGRIPLVETIDGFAELQLYGMLRYWGVSNLDVDDMIEPPWPAQDGIPTIAHSPIERGRLLECTALQAITHRHGATPAQIAPATKAHPSCDGGGPANNASEMA